MYRRTMIFVRPFERMMQFSTDTSRTSSVAPLVFRSERVANVEFVEIGNVAET